MLTQVHGGLGVAFIPRLTALTTGPQKAVAEGLTGSSTLNDLDDITFSP